MYEKLIVCLLCLLVLFIPLQCDLEAFREKLRGQTLFQIKQCLTVLNNTNVQTCTSFTSGFYVTYVVNFCMTLSGNGTRFADKVGT